MKKKLFFIKIIVFYLFLNATVIAKESNYFNEGMKYFKKKQFEKSKILFERDLVFNPKSENAYFYLAKIYGQNNNIEEEEFNLNNVLLLNPKNDEAIYMLVLIKIKQSDYNHAKQLINTLDLVCKSFCSKKSELEEKLKNLTPENAKNIN